MAKSFATCLIFSIFLLGKGFGEEKFVIGAFPAEGFFSSFLFVLGNLMWTEKKGKIPVVHWGEKCLYYQREGYMGQSNTWEYYFEPVSHLTYDSSDTEWVRGDTPDHWHLFRWAMADPGDFQRVLKFLAKEAIDKYIRIKPRIQDKIDAFYEKNMEGRRTVGIHLRGTDSCTSHRKEEIALAMIKEAEEALPEKSIQFFVATDDETLLDIAKQHLRGEVLYCNSHRSLDGSPLHTSYTNSQIRALVGEEVLIEAMLLARCDFLVYTHSCLPVAVMMFNPQLKSAYVNPNLR